MLAVGCSTILASRSGGVFHMARYLFKTMRSAAVLACCASQAQTNSVQCNFDSIVSTSNIQSITYDVALVGHHAFVATGASSNAGGIEIYDIADPAQPIHVGSMFESQRISRVLVDGNIAFVFAEFPAMVFAIDVSNPQSPQVLGSIQVPGSFDSAVLNGTALYVSVYAQDPLERGVYVIDVSDTSNLVQTDRLAYNGLPDEMAFTEGTLFLPASLTRLYMFDCAQPLSPQSLLVDETTEYGNLFVAEAGLLYANRADEVVCAIDVSDPQAILDLGVIDMVPLSDFAISGNTSYVGRSDGIYKYDIADPLNPILLGNFSSPSFASAIAYQDGLVYTTGGGNGFDILNLSSVPESPLLAGLTGSGRFVGLAERAVAINGDTVYVWHIKVGGNGNEVLTVDVSDPSNPTVLGSVPLVATDVQFTEQHVHVANPNGDYSIYDATDPDAWVLVGAIASVGPWDIEIRGNTAYLAGNTTISIVDISDPSSPSVIGSLESSVQGYSIEVGEDVAYIIGYDDSDLLIADTSDPSNPTEIATIALPFPVFDIELVGDLLYAVGSQDVCTIDVSSRASPVVTSVVPLLGLWGFVSIHHDDGVLFAAGVSLITMDLANPAHPVVSGWYDPSNVRSNRTSWMDVATSNGLAYINAGGGGLQVVDVSGPCSVLCLPDTNNDGTLSPADFSAWVAAFNTSAPECDQNDDSVCSPADFSAWVANYNAGCQ